MGRKLNKEAEKKGPGKASKKQKPPTGFGGNLTVCSHNKGRLSIYGLLITGYQ